MYISIFESYISFDIPVLIYQTRKCLRRVFSEARSCRRFSRFFLYSKIKSLYKNIFRIWHSHLAYRADALNEIVSVKRIGDEGREEADTERMGSRERRVLSSLSRERVYRINTRDAMKQGREPRRISRRRECANAVEGREEDVTARDRGATVDGNLFSSADGFVLFHVATVSV